MVKSKFDDIEVTFELKKIDDSYYPHLEEKIGLLWWEKTVKVYDRTSHYGKRHARAKVTEKVLDCVGDKLGKKVEIAGINREKFEEHFRPNQTYLMVNGQEQQHIGSVQFTPQRVLGGYGGDTVVSEGLVKVVVRGDSIESPSQFNDLQRSLHEYVFTK